MSSQEVNHSEVEPCANEAAPPHITEQHVDPTEEVMHTAAAPSAASTHHTESEAPPTHESYSSDARHESHHESCAMPSHGSQETTSSNAHESYNSFSHEDEKVTGEVHEEESSEHVTSANEESVHVTHDSHVCESCANRNEVSNTHWNTHESTEEDVEEETGSMQQDSKEDEENVDEDEENVDEDEENVDEDEENVDEDEENVDEDEENMDEDEENVDENEENVDEDEDIEDEDDACKTEENVHVDENEENVDGFEECREHQGNVHENEDDITDEEDDMDEETEDEMENDELSGNAESEEINRALKEAELQERRQVCSEIISLRKELSIVQKDENNLREQLAHMVKIIDEHDPEVNTNVARLEEEVYNSQMQQLWLEKCEELNPDNMDWSAMSIDNLAERTATARERFEQSLKEASDLYTRLENEINKHTDYRETIRRQMKSAFDEEIDNTADVRTRIKQIESEKKFHIKRGTTRRCQNIVVPEEKKTISRQKRIDEAELRTSAQIDAMQYELSELMASCKMMKQQLDNNRKIQAQKIQEMEETLHQIEESGAEVRQAKEKLLKEEAELSGLKAEMQGVLHYVRVKNRQNEII